MPDKTVIDGEIVAVDSADGPLSNALQNYGGDKTPLLYYVFDVLVSSRSARANATRADGPRVAVDASRIGALRSQGQSWSTICRETSIAKGTAQRAFHSLHVV